MGKKALFLLWETIFWFLTIIVAALAVVAFTAGMLPPHKSWFVAMIALLLTPILIVNALFFVIWVFKKSWWAIVPLAVVVLNYGYIISIFQVDLRAEKNIPPSELKVLTYNIHGYGRKDFNKYVTEILDYCQFSGVDMVCMQEYWQPAERPDTLSHPSYPYHVIHSPYEGMQLALWSRYPIESSEDIIFGQTINGAMAACINMPGHKLRVVCVHMQTTNFNQSKNEIAMIKELGIEDPNGKKTFDLVMKRLSVNAARRSQQVAQLRKYIDPHLGENIIVCGDFNDTPSSFTYNQLIKGLYDSFRQAGCGYTYTMSGLFRMYRVDYIFSSENLRAVRYDSPRSSWSDHYPVVAEFIFNHESTH